MTEHTILGLETADSVGET